MACSRFVAGVAGLLLCCGAAAPLSAQCQANQACDIGRFSGPWDWDGQVCAYYQGCDNNSTIEFYHGAVLTKGLHKGKVLLTRVDSRGPEVGGDCPNTGRLESWLFDPASPTVLIHIEHAVVVPDFMNCAGNTWDTRGRLVMVGGAPTGSGPNKRVFRFDPMQLGTIQLRSFPYPPTGPTCSVAYITAEPWSEIGALEEGRYYATAMTGTREPIDDPGQCTDGIGGATFAIGGPPTPQGTPQGNYVWEMLDPTGTMWACPLVPKQFPHGFSTYREFELMPMGNPPNPRLDSYPKAFQLSRAAQRQIFVAGDTQTTTAGRPPGLPTRTGKETWTKKIPYANLQDPQTDWEQWNSPEMEIQHSYGNAVLMFTKDDVDQRVDNRVLVIGGGQHAVQAPNGSWPLTGVTNVVREYIPDTDASSGQWENNKQKLTRDRHHLNSVLLPDGTILVVGGRSGTGAHTTPPDPVVPIFQPEIYDPGPTPNSTGSTKLMAPSKQASWGPPSTPTRVPRLYHSMAFLLPDGRVFVVGGRHLGDNWSDSRMSGEIFSPPYLFEGDQPVARPWILGVTTSNQSYQQLSTGGNVKSFTVEVTTQAGKIKMVSAIRISSVTHHFDSDQRFIELDRHSDGVAGGTSIITVDAPMEDMAPQGWYYLFVLEEEGDVPGGRLIPSVAHFINFQ